MKGEVELTEVFLRSRTDAELAEMLERLGFEAEVLGGLDALPPSSAASAQLLGRVNRIAAEVDRRKAVRK